MSLLLVAMPFAPSSVLAPSSDVRVNLENGVLLWKNGACAKVLAAIPPKEL